MSFLAYSNKLRQNIPALSPQQAEDYVNQAWRDIRDSDDEWSFLHRTEYWLAPAVITCVGLTVTQNSATVGLTAAAVVQLTGLNNPPVTVRQFRLNGGGGPVYSITAFDGVGMTLTLDRLYRETTNTNATGVVQRLYYQPLEDMARLDHVTDNITGYQFAFEIGTPDEIDRFDPQRAAVGLPYALFFHDFDPVSGLPIYEMWPGPQAERAYTVTYWARGADFVDDEDALPVQVPEELLMLRAQLLGYEWLMTATPELKRLPAIQAMMEQVRWRYSSYGNPQARLGLLERTRRKDHSVYRKAFIKRRRYGNGMYPITSSFMQRVDAGYGGGYLGQWS
jgi:hypothetical protein